MRKLTLAKLWLSSAVLNKRHISLHWICRIAMRVMSGHILRRTPRSGWTVMCMRLRFLARCRSQFSMIMTGVWSPRSCRPLGHASMPCQARDGTRKRTQRFSAMLSHYVIQDRYGRPGKGNDKGKVEGLVGYSRRNFMVPLSCM